MKKTLFAFMALVTAFAATSCQSDEKLLPFGQGQASVNAEAGIPDNEVKWIQLWENGPKFAEYNVGATSATEYGGYYTWGGTYQNGQGVQWNDDHKTDSTALSGTNDTATNLWGSNWKMPTKTDFDNLLAKCDYVWTNDYKNDGTNIKGIIFTGRNAYKNNSVFFPAADNCYHGRVGGLGRCGNYWSSAPAPDGRGTAYALLFDSADNLIVSLNIRNDGYSVRAVLAE